MSIEHNISYMNQKEQNIVRKAIENLEKETNLRILPQFYNDKRTDLVIRMQEYEIAFTAEVILFVNRARIGLIAQKLKSVKGVPLLITEYVNPQLLNTVRELGINFIDAAGNAFINEPPLFINIKGNKIFKPITRETGERTFYTAGLQTVYQLLCNPGLEKNTIREIAEEANVAAGTVHITLKELVKQGYLVKQDNGQNKLINKEDLLKKWITQYPDKLKPKYFIARYEVEGEKFIENLDIKKYGALWGGEVAAAKLTGYLCPYIYTIYMGEKRGEFILRNRLKKNVNGKLELIKKFWKFDDKRYNELTHPILVYADLMATGDPRNIETANIIYEKYLIEYIR